MANKDKNISDLPETTILHGSDVTPVVQAGTPRDITTKVTLENLGTFVSEDLTLDSLDTTNKTLVGAINEVNAGTGGAASLEELDDVSITSPQDTQVLKYDSATSKWINGTDSDTDYLDDLKDVAIATPTGGQVLSYDSAASKWKNTDPSSGASALDDLTDVDITSPTAGQVIVYDDVSDKWVNGAGGGSGGHIILDNAGDSLTQRDNLQFIGAYSEDNSTDNTTEVNVVRSMTKAEFDLLSADEKTGIINVTDDVSGGLKYVKTVLWENIDEDNMTILTDGDTISLSDNILDYDEVYFEGCFLDPTLPAGNHISHLASSKVLKETLQLAKSKYGSQTFQGIFDVGLNYVYYNANHSFNYSLKMPTDNSLYVAQKFTVGWAASGCTLTRIIGIKYLSDSENTYSTDEHIVGTWIDGDTLYEKTWNITAPSSNASTRVIDLSGMNINKIIFQDAFISVSDNTTPHGGGAFVIWYRTPNNATTPNNCIMCTISNSTYYGGDMNVTLRYTKSST